MKQGRWENKPEHKNKEMFRNARKRFAQPVGTASGGV